MSNVSKVYGFSVLASSNRALSTLKSKVSIGNGTTDGPGSLVDFCGACVKDVLVVQ